MGRYDPFRSAFAFRVAVFWMLFFTLSAVVGLVQGVWWIAQVVAVVWLVLLREGLYWRRMGWRPPRRDEKMPRSPHFARGAFLSRLLGALGVLLVALAVVQFAAGEPRTALALLSPASWVGWYFLGRRADALSGHERAAESARKDPPLQHEKGPQMRVDER